MAIFPADNRFFPVARIVAARLHDTCMTGEGYGALPFTDGDTKTWILLKK